MVYKIKNYAGYFTGALAVVLLSAFSLCFMALPASASDTVIAYENPDTGYHAYIEDEAGLIEDEEMPALTEAMAEITRYSDVIFATTDTNPYSTENFARFCSKKYSKNCVTLVIDMKNRYVYIDSMGKMRLNIHSRDAKDIADNIYMEASWGNYATCAILGFRQINSLSTGRFIARPMKYICTLIISVFLALIVAYIWAYNTSTVRKAANKDMLENVIHYCKLSDIHSRMTASVRGYSPRSRAHSHGGHGGGFGGGGHSGGGHSF